MPKNAIDYSKTIIYKIVCKDLMINECYISSTTDFTRRKAQHKRKCGKDLINERIYHVIQNNGGWSNWDMVMIEPFPCQNSNEAYKRERYWYETLGSF